MNPELQSWLAQMPWGPVATVSALAVLWFVSSLSSRKKKAVLAAKLAAGAIVIDVRTKAEYASGHHDGARNIPLDTLGSQLKKLGTADQPIVVYCASGARSAQAVAQLKAAGYADVTNAGGLAALRGLA